MIYVLGKKQNLLAKTGSPHFVFVYLLSLYTLHSKKNYSFNECLVKYRRILVSIDIDFL